MLKKLILTSRQLPFLLAFVVTAIFILSSTSGAWGKFLVGLIATYLSLQIYKHKKYYLRQLSQREFLLLWAGFIFLVIWSVSSLVTAFFGRGLADHQLINATLADQKLQLEIVNTPASITQGLSGRDSIGSDGMLFILPEKKKAQFWMKGMKFALDIVWLDGNKIIEITENIPLTNLQIYSPQLPVDKVLELPAGKASELGLEVGDKIKL